MVTIHRLFGIVMTTATLLAVAPASFAGDTTLVSVTADGTQGKGQSREPSISADGRFVCFESRATNLVDGDNNKKWDVFVKDLQTGQLRRISVSSSGEEGNDFSTMAVISADGSTVAFMSAATNLVPNDTNNDWDFFAHDLQTSETTRISVSSSGEQGNGGANCDCRVYKFPGVSEDGRIITFHSSSSNLVDDDTNGKFDIFRHDRDTGETVRISLSTAGVQADADCWIRDMSLDGRFTVWHSASTTLSPNDTNGVRDVFINDFLTGVTELISVPVGGGETNDISDSPRVSADGRFVAFASLATNLIPDDTNGQWDVFLRDRELSETRMISVSSEGEHGDIFSRHPSISANGRKITFHSVTTNLVPGDTNDVRDIFMYDRFLEQTIRVSTASDGAQSNDVSYDAFISPNGRWVVFDSGADNLVPDDTNNNRDIFLVDLFDQSLASSNPIPGFAGENNTWVITSASPGATVSLVYGNSIGNGPNIPGCSLNFQIENPKLVGTTSVGADGIALIEISVGGKAAGRQLYFQAIESISCRRSDIVSFIFE